MELCFLLISTYLLSNSCVAHFVIFLHLCFNGSLDACNGLELCGWLLWIEVIATDASVCSSLVVYCPAANYPEHEDEGAFSSFVLWCLCAHVVLLILSLLWALFRWCTTRLEHYNALAPVSFSWSSWRWNIMHFWDVNENKSCFRTVNALLIVAFRQIRQHWWKLLKLRFKLNS